MDGRGRVKFCFGTKQLKEGMGIMGSKEQKPGNERKKKNEGEGKGRKFWRQAGEQRAVGSVESAKKDCERHQK